jgi:hypothetical protein
LKIVFFKSFLFNVARENVFLGYGVVGKYGQEWRATLCQPKGEAGFGRTGLTGHIAAW